MNEKEFTAQIPLDCRYLGNLYLMAASYVSIVRDIYLWFLQHPWEQSKTEWTKFKVGKTNLLSLMQGNADLHF